MTIRLDSGRGRAHRDRGESPVLPFAARLGGHPEWIVHDGE
jgi:hypothetical protein